MRATLAPQTQRPAPATTQLKAESLAATPPAIGQAAPNTIKPTSAGSDHIWQAISASAQPATAPRSAFAAMNRASGRRVGLQKAVAQRVKKTEVDEEWKPPGTRRQYLMGATPNKTSPTGRALLRRWEGSGKARYSGTNIGVLKYKDTANWHVHIPTTSSGRRSWVKLNAQYRSKNNKLKTAIHMGHKLSAAEYYSRGATRFIKKKPLKYGRRYARYKKAGKKMSEQHRKMFMKEPENYRFEWYSLNSSAGSGGYTYQ